MPNTQASRLARAVVGVALLWVGLAALRWFERTERHNVTSLQRASLILQRCALPALALTSADLDRDANSLQDLLFLILTPLMPAPRKSRT